MIAQKSRPGEKAANPLDENCYQYSAPDPIYEARLAAWLEGFHSRDAEIASLNWTADRLYTEMCRRSAVPFIDVNRPSFAQLQRIRADIYGGAR